MRAINLALYSASLSTLITLCQIYYLKLFPEPLPNCIVISAKKADAAGRGDADKKRNFLAASVYQAGKAMPFGRDNCMLDLF